jgi:hypothetical protein
MSLKFSTIQKFALLYGVMFLFVVTISHWPGLTDAQGRLMGLFKIDPIDDIFHLLSGIAAVIVGMKSIRWSKIFFIVVAIPYGLDAITGLLFSREFLNLNVFTEGLGAPNFSVSNILINLPHVLITIVALWIGLSFSKRYNNGRVA